MSFGKPLDYDAGLAFNYDVWTPGTRVELHQVEWDSVYRDTVLFESKAERDAYFAGKSYRHDIDRARYLRRGEPVALSVPFSDAVKYNYMVVRNPAQPIAGDAPTDFFYFVRDVEHSAPDTTKFYLQLDVWQTYMYDVTVNRGFLARGHYAVKRVEEHNTPRISTWAREPEGLDTGSIYATPNLTPYVSGINVSSVDHMLAITTTTSFKSSPGTRDNPENPPAKGSDLWGAKVPTETYFIDSGAFQSFMGAMVYWPWTAQGIISVVAIPKISSNALKPTTQIDVDLGAGIGVKKFPPNGLYEADRKGGTVNPRDIYNVPDWPGIDSDIRAAHEYEFGGPTPYLWMSKFLTFPYCYLSITDGVGNELVLHPQWLRSVTMKLQAWASLVPGNEVVRVVVENYLAAANTHDYSLSMRNLPRLPTVNDNAAIALASQAHSIQSARSGAAWGQRKALAGNANSFDNATLGMWGADNATAINQRADMAQTELGNRAASDQAIMGAIVSTAGGASAGAVGGGAGAAFGAASGAVQGIAGIMSTSMQNNVNNESLGLRNQATNAQRANTMGIGSSIRDNNKGLADWAARGDYANQIDAMQAKIQDTEMTPASMAGQYGGEVATWAMRASVYQITGRVKTIAGHMLERIGMMWARYGYMCNKYVMVNNQLNLMTRLTYWQLVDPHITGVPGMSEDSLNALRGIFERGVTIYRKPDYIKEFNLNVNRIA